MPSPTTTAFQPRCGFFNAVSSREASSRRSHGTDRDWPMSKYSATTVPPSGSTNFCGFDTCQPCEATADGRVAQRSATTTGQKAVLTALQLPEPPKYFEFSAATSWPDRSQVTTAV